MIKKNYVEVQTVRETSEADEVFEAVESVKMISDLFLPVSCEILEYSGRW